MKTRALLSLLVLVVAGARVVHGQPSPPGRYAGRVVIEVLRDLTRQGLRVVFSTSLVRPTLRVAAEPPGPTLRDVLEQVLAPHGLVVREGPGGTLLVARAPRRVAGASARPQVGVLRGRVVDADTGAPLAGVLVVAENSQQRTSTGVDGIFELADVAEGRHHLFVSLIGYVLARPEVAVAPGRTAEVVVPLVPGTGAYTEALTVRAPEAARQAAPVEFRLGSAELQEVRGVLTDDPFRALQAVPGVATGDDFRAEFSVRGSEFRQIGFTVDGVPVPWLVHGPREVNDSGTVAMVNGDVFDEVAVTSGAGPQMYGNRTGAWVQSTIREGSRDTFRMSGMLSGTGASAVLEGPLGRERRGAWLVSARKSYIDWLIRRLDTQETTTFGFADAQVKVTYDVTPRQQVELTAIGGRSSFEEREDAPGVNSVHVGRSATALAIGHWRATLGDRVVLHQRTAWSGVRYRNTSAFDQELTRGIEWQATSRVDATYAPGRAATFDAGLSMDREWATVRQQQYAPGRDVVLPLRTWSTWQRDRWRSGAYARARIAADGPLALEAGVRADRDTFESSVTASPWLLARWNPTTRVTVAAGASESRQAPELRMLPPIGVSAILRPERARSADASVAVSLAGNVRATAAVYGREEEGTIALDVASPRLRDEQLFVPFASGLWSNRVDVRARGIEVALRRTGGQGPVGWVAYAYGTTRSTDRLTGEVYWADFDQRHQLNVHVSQRLGARTNASGRFRFGTNMPVTGYFASTSDALALAPTRNNVRLPVYARLDLRLNRTYNYRTRRLTLFTEVLNVLGRENVGRTDGIVRSTGQVAGFTETLFPRLPSAGLRIEF